MNTKTRLAISVVIIAIVGLTGFVVGRIGSSETGTSDVQEVSKSFVTALTKGDVDSTYNLATENYQARNTKEYVESVSKGLKSDNPEIKNEEIFMGTNKSKKEAMYLSTVENLPRTDTNSTKGNFVIRLVQVDGKWKVDSSQIY